MLSDGDDDIRAEDAVSGATRTECLATETAAAATVGSGSDSTQWLWWRRVVVEDRSCCAVAEQLPQPLLVLQRLRLLSSRSVRLCIVQLRQPVVLTAAELPQKQLWTRVAEAAVAAAVLVAVGLPPPPPLEAPAAIILRHMTTLLLSRRLGLRP
jgi:hypothetical protein